MRQDSPPLDARMSLRLLRWRWDEAMRLWAVSAVSWVWAIYMTSWKFVPWMTTTARKPRGNGNDERLNNGDRN